MTDGWLPNSSQHVFSKARKRIVGRVKRSESPSVQVPQSSEEDLVVWKRTPRGLRGHQSVSLAPTGTMCLLCKCGKIVPKTYSRLIPVLMNNMFRRDLKPICYIPIREALGRIAHLSLSKRQHKHSTAVHELWCVKVEYRWCCKLSLYDPWWGLL